MRIGITGSRSITDKDYIINCIESVVLRRRNMTFILGNAIGVDTIAKNYLKSRYNTIVLKPAHQYVYDIPYTPLLYKARDMEIVDNCDMLIAIWDGVSRGTKMTMDIAKTNNIKVKLFMSE